MCLSFQISDNSSSGFSEVAGLSLLASFGALTSDLFSSNSSIHLVITAPATDLELHWSDSANVWMLLAGDPGGLFSL